MVMRPILKHCVRRYQEKGKGEEEADKVSQSSDRSQERRKERSTAWGEREEGKKTNVGRDRNAANDLPISSRSALPVSSREDSRPGSAEVGREDSDLGRTVGGGLGALLVLGRNQEGSDEVDLLQSGVKDMCW
jgi:hypothetical protein